MTRDVRNRVHALRWRLETGVMQRLYRVAETRWGRGDELWRLVMNRRAARQQARVPLPISTPVARQALAALQTDGIAILRMEDLEGGGALFNQLLEEEAHVWSSRETEMAARRIEAARQGRAIHKGYALPALQ